MTLSEKITHCRKKAMLSQEALAEKIGVSRQAVSKWETGESLPELGKIASLARALNTSVDWLLSSEEPQGEPLAQEKTSAEYPEWTDRIPEFFRKLIYRYGWLFGIGVSISGTIFAAIGLLVQYISNQMLSGFKNTALGFGGIYEQLGGTYGDIPGSPVTGLLENMTANDPVSIIGKCSVIFGVVLIVAGVLLAILLKNHGRKRT